MYKIYTLTIAALLLAALVTTAINAPPINAQPASSYSLDFDRINEGGHYSTSTGNYDLIDEVRATGATGETQTSSNYAVTDVTSEQIIATTPSKTKNWEHYK